MKSSVLALVAAGMVGTGNSTVVLPVLQTLTITPVAGTLVAGSLTAGQVVATIAGKTAGSAIAENNPYVDVSGLNVVLTAAGAALGASSTVVSIVETLQGAVGSPKNTDFQLVVQAAPVAVKTLSLQAVGTLTKAGVPVNPINRLATGATISAGGSGHFTIAAGLISVTNAGDTADLPGGPYTLTILGDAAYNQVVIPTEASKYTVTTHTELIAAVNAADVNVYSKIEIPDGVTINPRLPTDMSQADFYFTVPARPFTATLNDPNYNKTMAEIMANPNAIATFTGGGYVEITCRTKWAGRIDQGMNIAGSSKGVIYTNLAWVGTAFVVTQVGGAATLFGDNTVYTGGTGYKSTDTWTWSDPASGAAMSGTFSVDGTGKLTGAQITSKNAFVEDAIGKPIRLQNAATGNGIRTSTGTGGTLFLLHDNYAMGPPPGAPNFVYQGTNNNVNIGTTGVTPSNFSTHPQAVFRNCYNGGGLTKPGKPGQWRSQHGFRWMSRVIVEDCTFHSFRNGTGVQECPEAVFRRNDFQMYLEDCMRFFSGGRAQQFTYTDQRAIVHDNAAHNNYSGSDFVNYHSDFAQFGSPNDDFGHHGILFNNRSVMPKGSTQAIYNDDSYDSPIGTFLEAANNLIVIAAYDMHPSFRAPQTRDIIKNSTYLRASGIVSQVGRMPQRNTWGTTADKVITGEWSDQTYFPYGGYTIYTPGTGYLVNDRIAFHDGFGQYGYGRISEVNASGGVTRIVWDKVPAGLPGAGKYMDCSGGKLQIALAKFPNPMQGRNASTNVWTDTGTGLQISLLADASAYPSPSPSNKQENGTMALTNGYGSVVTTNCRYVAEDVEPAALTGKSFPELFVGPPGGFVRSYSTYTDPQGRVFNTRAWDWEAGVDHTTRLTFFASIDAIFTPKPGSYIAGTGHTIPV